MAPREALVVLYREMHAESQWRIRMVIEIAGEPSVLFVIVNLRKKQYSNHLKANLSF